MLFSVWDENTKLGLATLIVITVFLGFSENRESQGPDLNREDSPCSSSGLKFVAGCDSSRLLVAKSQGPDLNRRGFRSAGGCVGPDSATLAHQYLLHLLA